MKLQAQITSIHTRSSRTENLAFQTKYLSELIDREVVNTETQNCALEPYLEQSQSTEK